MKLRRIALWAAFIAAHLLVAWLGWVYPSQPMGDVVLVYEPWSTAALTGGTVVGITEPWVYPQLALLPMLLAGVLALPLVAWLGASGAYLIAWALLVTAVDAVAFAVLLGRSPRRSRRGAAWFWIAVLLLMGPIALYRIDAIAVPLALIGGLWLVRRPTVAAMLLTIGAWIKIWPGALVLAAVVAARARVRMLLAAVATAATIMVVVFLLGADRELFGFLSAQTGRGLQIEAVAATPFLWLRGEGAIEYSFQILTFQIHAPGSGFVADLLTPLMVLAVGAVTVLGALKALRGASFARLFPPLAVALVASLIVTNKVGSPQFQTWLIAPIMLWIVFDRRRSHAPAIIVMALAALTCLIYPLSYDALLRAELVPLLLLSARNALLIVLLALSIHSIRRVTTRDPSINRK